LITISKSTVQEYNDLCGLTNNENLGRPEDHSQEWESDKMKLLELLQNGKAVSMARIEKLTAGGKKDDVDPSSEFPYNEAPNYFKERHSEKTRMAKTLHYASKGVSKMAKALPEYES
jgi:hypothetical protein